MVVVGWAELFPCPPVTPFPSSILSPSVTPFPCLPPPPLLSSYYPPTVSLRSPASRPSSYCPPTVSFHSTVPHPPLLLLSAHSVTSFLCLIRFFLDEHFVSIRSSALRASYKPDRHSDKSSCLIECSAFNRPCRILRIQPERQQVVSPCRFYESPGTRTSTHSLPTLRVILSDSKLSLLIELRSTGTQTSSHSLT